MLRDAHLTPEDIEILTSIGADVAQEPERIASHLEECGECRALLLDRFRKGDVLGNLRSAVRNMPTGSCPDPGVWTEVAAGLSSPEGNGELLDHLASCDFCGRTFAQAVFDLSVAISPEESAFVEGLPSSRVSTQRELAARMSVTPASPAKRRTIRVNVWGPLAASLAALPIIALFFWYKRDPAPPFDLLATAYTEQRTLALRWPRARQAPLRLSRGGSAGAATPTALMEGELLIRRGLERHPSDPAWLQAQARAALLEWRFDDAIQLLRQALNLQPRSADLLADLATAHFERAEAFSRAQDYGAAADLLGQALQIRPVNGTDLFNLALVYERLNFLREAKKTWMDFLRVESSGAWADEAREHLDSVKRKLEQSGRSTHGNADEDLMQKPGSWFSNAAGENPAGMVIRHGDRWLMDLAACRQSGEEMSLLARSVQENQTGDRSAADHSRRAEHLFRLAACPAGWMRSALEQTYALQRKSDGATCLSEINRNATDIMASRYSWIRGQFRVQEAVCADMDGNSKRAAKAAAQAVLEATAANYPTLYLRAIGIRAASLSGLGQRREAWQIDLTGLTAYWNGDFPPIRAQQFYSDIMLNSEASHRWFLAVAAGREAAEASAGQPNRAVEGMVRTRLAEYELRAGLLPESERELAAARGIFQALPDTDTNRMYSAWGAIGLAALDGQRGLPQRALERLGPIKSQLNHVSNELVAARFLRTKAFLLRSIGKYDESERNLAAAAALGETRLPTINGVRDRMFWQRDMTEVYRDLVDAYERRGAAREAFDLWEWYRKSPLRAVSQSSLKSVHPDLTKIFRGGVGDTIPSARLTGLPSDQMILSYAVLADSVMIWIADSHEFFHTRVRVDAAQVGNLARRFARSCGDRASSAAEVRESGRALAALVIAPVMGNLIRGRVLRIETDGDLSRVPFQALPLDDGTILGSSLG